VKRSAELIGLPIMSIEEGIELGKVKDIIIHPQKKEINSLVIEDNSWWKEAKIISFGLIRGIEETITVINSSSVVTISSLPEVERMLENKVSVVDSNVITCSGKLIGRIQEYFIDKKTGNIEAYLLTEQKILPDYYGDLLLPKNCITTLGKKVVVVADEVVQYAKKFTEVEKEISEEESWEPTLAAEVNNYQTDFKFKKEESSQDVDTTIAEVEKLLEETKARSQSPESREQVIREQAIVDKLSPPADIVFEDKEKDIKKEESDELSKLISSLDEELTKKSEEKKQKTEEELAPINTAETAETITAKEEIPLIPETTKEKTEDKKIKPEIKPGAEVKEKPATETPKKPDLSKIFEERIKKTTLGKKAIKKIIAADASVIINEGEEITEEVIAKAKVANKLMELASVAR